MFKRSLILLINFIPGVNKIYYTEGGYAAKRLEGAEDATGDNDCCSEARQQGKPPMCRCVHRDTIETTRARGRTYIDIQDSKAYAARVRRKDDEEEETECNQNNNNNNNNNNNSNNNNNMNRTINNNNNNINIYNPFSRLVPPGLSDHPPSLAVQLHRRSMPSSAVGLMALDIHDRIEIHGWLPKPTEEMVN